MRPIDADKLIENIENTADLGGWIGDTLRQIKWLAVRYINSTPSIDIDRPQEWIPCSERLPEPNRHDALNVDVYYLAQTEFGDMIVASYNESHEGTKWWEQMYSYRIFDDEIVAWMPLPKPYREDGEA